MSGFMLPVLRRFRCMTSLLLNVWVCLWEFSHWWFIEYAGSGGVFVCFCVAIRVFVLLLFWLSCWAMYGLLVFWLYLLGRGVRCVKTCFSHIFQYFDYRVVSDFCGGFGLAWWITIHWWLWFIMSWGLRICEVFSSVVGGGCEIDFWGWVSFVCVLVGYASFLLRTYVWVLDGFWFRFGDWWVYMLVFRLVGCECAIFIKIIIVRFNLFSGVPIKNTLPIQISIIFLGLSLFYD